MDISEVKDKRTYYFVNYVLCHEVDTAVFFDKAEAEEFITHIEDGTRGTGIVFVCRGQLITAKPTEIKTCYKIED